MHELASPGDELANPAARLYLAEGYRVVDRRENSDTMVLDLGVTAR